MLKNLAKYDNRIKIVNNNKNCGLLYSRAMGILNSSGEYILNLDPDDELNDNKCLEYLYNQITISNADIITFDIYDKKEKKIIKCENSNEIVKQPALYNSIFGESNFLNDYLIWNKLISHEIYLDAYEDFKKEIYNDKWNYHEDLIWSILVNKHAKSKLCKNQLVYIYNYNNDSLKNQMNWNDEFQNLLYLLEKSKQIFSTKNEEKYLIALQFWILNNFKIGIKYLLKMNEPKIKDKIISVFKFFLAKYQYSIEQKNEINSFLKSIYK